MAEARARISYVTLRVPEHSNPGKPQGKKGGLSVEASARLLTVETGAQTLTVERGNGQLTPFQADIEWQIQRRNLERQAMGQPPLTPAEEQQIARKIRAGQ